MSHFRDRVITTPNIPQLPSGIRAKPNSPFIVQSVALALAVNRTPITITVPTTDITSGVPVGTRTAP